MGKSVFEKLVVKMFKTTVYKEALKDIYNCSGVRGHSTEQTRIIGVYALYFNNELMKIGKAVCKGGIFKRISQYYRGNHSDGGLSHITAVNRDQVQVEYFYLDREEDCWAAEKYLQAMAYYLDEDMPWDNEKHMGK